MAKGKRKSGIATILVVALLAGAAVFFGMKLIHKCDSCGNLFFGTGYTPNAVVDIIADDQDIICKDCAKKQHAISDLINGDIEKYHRGLFD